MMRGYDFIWRLARPLLPLMLAWRARSGKEDAARLTERFGRYDHRTICRMTRCGFTPSASAKPSPASRWQRPSARQVKPRRS